MTLIYINIINEYRGEDLNLFLETCLHDDSMRLTCKKGRKREHRATAQVIVDDDDDVIMDN